MILQTPDTGRGVWVAQSV